MDAQYLMKLNKYLSGRGFLTGEIKEIPYGVQFYVSDGEKKELIRIYQNTKGKITLDASQIKDADLKQYIQSYDTSGIAINGNQVINKIMLAPPLIGSDEAGKGDYFGPLTVAAVYADERQYKALISAGVKDSKLLSDIKISALAKEIVRICPHYSVIAIGNNKFNEFYEKTKNINAVLGWTHGRAIKNILDAVECKNVLVDKFGSTHWIENQLKDYKLNLVQEPKGEQNLAVAAASILARSAFVESMKKLNDAYKMDFPLGASELVDQCGIEFVKKYGAAKLREIAKISFKNTDRIISVR